MFPSNIRQTYAILTALEDYGEGFTCPIQAGNFTVVNGLGTGNTNDDDPDRQVCRFGCTLPLTRSTDIAGHVSFSTSLFLKFGDPESNAAAADAQHPYTKPFSAQFDVPGWTTLDGWNFRVTVVSIFFFSLLQS